MMLAAHMYVCVCVLYTHVFVCVCNIADRRQFVKSFTEFYFGKRFSISYPRARCTIKQSRWLVCVCVYIYYRSCKSDKLHA